MAFRSGWPGSFQLEPLDRYAETERERGAGIIGMSIAERQRQAAAKLAAQSVTATIGSMKLAPVPLAEEPKKKNTSIWGKVKSAADAVTPDALEAPAKTAGKGALKVMQAGQQYVGAPIGGITTGRLGAPQQTGPNGEVFREGSPSWTEFGKGIKKAATQNPIDTYKESRQAFNEGQKDPDLPAWKRIAAEGLSDPLTYVGPGAVKAGLKGPGALKAAITGREAIAAAPSTSKAVRFLGAILENPGRASAGGVIGSSAAGEVAKRTGLPELPATILGGIAGGILAAPGNVGRAGRAIDAASAAETKLLPATRFGSTELGGMEPIYHGTKNEAARTLSELSPTAYRDVPGAVLTGKGSHGLFAAAYADDAAEYGPNVIKGMIDDGQLLNLRDEAVAREFVEKAGLSEMKWPNGARYLGAGKGYEPTESSVLETILNGDFFHETSVPPEFRGRSHDFQNIIMRAAEEQGHKGLIISDTSARKGKRSYVIFDKSIIRPDETAAASTNVPLADASAVTPPAGELALPPAGGRTFTQEEVIPALQRRIDETRPPGAIPPPPPGPFTKKQVVTALKDRIDQTRPPGAIPEPPAPKPRIDMFDTISGDARLAEEARFNSTLRGKADRGIRAIGAKAGGEKFDKNLKGSDAKTFIVKEKNRIDTAISSYEAQADDLFMGLQNSGLNVVADDAGTLRTPSGTAFEDLLERRTAATKAEFDALPMEQQNAIRALDAWNEQLNANLRYHQGRDLGWDNTDKRYFPRVSVGADGKKRAFVENGGGRAVGRTQGFSKERTFEDVFQEGLDAGIDYGDPRNSWRIMTRAKLRAAEDAALANRLKPMGVTKKNIPQGERIGVDWIAVPRDVAPALSGRYFPPEVAQQITSALTPQNAFAAKVITEFNKKATPLRAMADLSFLLQQGSAMIFHPRHAWKVPKATIDVIRSTKNRAVYDRMIKSTGMNLDEAIKHGLVWGADDIAANDFALTKIGTEGAIRSKPGIKQAATAFNKVADFSNQTYGRYMNYVRANFVKDAQERLASMKGSMSPEEWRKEYQGAMNAINRLSGTTGRKVSSLESMSLFAPRYFSASVEQLNAAITRGGLEGSIARAHLGRMVAFGAAIVIGSNELRGKETELDPRSSNFLRFRDVGGLDVSPFGTYDTLFRAIAGTAAGDPGGDISPDSTKLWKLAEGKMSPGLKLIYEPFIRKATYSGEPLDPSSLGGMANIVKEQAVAGLPFSAQNALTEGIVPAIQERSLTPLKDAVPGFLASGGGATNSPVTPTEKRNFRTEKLAMEKYGKKFEDLSGTEKSIINEDPEVRKWQAEADKNIDTLVDDRSVNRRASIEREAAIESLTQQLDGGEIAGSEFRKRYRDIQMMSRGAREVLAQRQSDPEIEAYFKVFDQAERRDKSTDYELLDQLLPAYVAAHPGIEDKVDRIIGTKDNATMREFRVAQAQARDFYALPQYLGLSVDEGQRAAPILAFARRLVSNNQAAGYKEAVIAMLQNGDVSREDALLALRAQKLGTSPERKAFKLGHPEYRKFYNDEVVDEDYAAAGTFVDDPKKTSFGSSGFSLGKGIGGFSLGGASKGFSLAPIG